MNRIMMALLSGLAYGFIAFGISTWIAMKIEDRWPSNYCTGTGMPPGCFLFIVGVLTLIAAVVGTAMSWREH